MIDLLLSLIESPLVWLSGLFARSRTVKTPKSEAGLGTDLETREPFGLSPRDLARHTYILGSTGCGKTTLILKLIEQDIARHHSVVVLDLRGDLVEGVVSLCSRLDVEPDRITLLDLREKGSALGFNPLAGAGEPYIRALHVLDVVAAEAESWGVQLEETMRSALLLLASSGQPLTKLEPLFYDRGFRISCLAEVSDETVIGFWDRYDSLSSEKQQAWAMPVMNKVTSLLAVPVLRNVLSASPGISLEKVLNDKGHIFLVSLAVDELHRSSRMLGSLLVSAISREMMARVHLPEKLRNPVRLYIDEFENFGSESFEGLIAEGRRFGLTLVLSHQTLSQLPPKLRSVIRNNVGVQLIFQCGYDDARVIARELPTGTDSAAIRGLATGQALVMMRDGETTPVQFHPPKKGGSQSSVKAFRQELLVSRNPDPDLPVEKPAAQSSATSMKEEWL